MPTKHPDRQKDRYEQPYFIGPFGLLPRVNTKGIVEKLLKYTVQLESIFYKILAIKMLFLICNIIWSEVENYYQMSSLYKKVVQFSTHEKIYCTIVLTLNIVDLSS